MMLSHASQSFSDEDREPPSSAKHLAGSVRMLTRRFLLALCPTLHEYLVNQFSPVPVYFQISRFLAVPRRNL